MRGHGHYVTRHKGRKGRGGPRQRCCSLPRPIHSHPHSLPSKRTQRHADVHKGTPRRHRRGPPIRLRVFPPPPSPSWRSLLRAAKKSTMTPIAEKGGGRTREEGALGRRGGGVSRPMIFTASPTPTSSHLPSTFFFAVFEWRKGETPRGGACGEAGCSHSCKENLLPFFFRGGLKRAQACATGTARRR